MTNQKKLAIEPEDGYFLLPDKEKNDNYYQRQWRYVYKVHPEYFRAISTL